MTKKRERKQLEEPEQSSDASESENEASSCHSEVEQEEEYSGEILSVRIAGLNFNTTEETLHAFLEEHVGDNTIASLRMPKYAHKPNQNRGLAFVDFKGMSAAQKALKLNKQKLEGRWLEVSMAKSSDNKGRVDRENRKLSAKPDDCTTVFVGNLPYGSAAADVTELMKQFGGVKDVRMISKQGRPLGSAYVDFVQTESTDKAVAAAVHKKLDLGGRKLWVDFAQSSRDVRQGYNQKRRKSHGVHSDPRDRARRYGHRRRLQRDDRLG
ncbi:MAG: hypothetical protein MHM6MM_004431 [Cercozoa sp. M6MM]